LAANRAIASACAAIDRGETAVAVAQGVSVTDSRPADWLAAVGVKKRENRIDRCNWVARIAQPLLAPCDFGRAGWWHGGGKNELAYETRLVDGKFLGDQATK
jgi:hypothetical protein